MFCRLKLKKGNSIKKGPALPQCSWKKTPTKFNTGSSTVTLNHSKQRPRPSPLPVLLRKPTSESKSRVRPVNGSHLSTPSRQPPVYRLGTPRHRVVSPGSTLTKATRLASPGTTLTKATRLASQSSTGEFMTVVPIDSVMTLGHKTFNHTTLGHTSDAIFGHDSGSTTHWCIF